MSDAWSRQAAARIGHRHGQLAVATDRPVRNPFTGKGLDELAAAWQHAYDRAVHPSSGPDGYRSS